MGVGSFIKVVAKNFDVLAGPLVSLVYPLYASVKAIETKSPVDDQQWLTYWVLHSLLTLFELTFAQVIEWLPFWPHARLIFNCWLVLPYFNGAAYVYQHFVRPFCINQQTVNIWYVPRKKSIFSRPDDVLLAAEKFIEENGPEAFQNLMEKGRTASKSKTSKKGVTSDESEAQKASKSNKSKKRVTFDETEAQKALKSGKGSNKNGNADEGQNTKTSDALSSKWHATVDELNAENESNFWRNSSFMIFDEDHRYWT